MATLDSIDPKELSTGDRHFYDLLTIKANDKNYNTHTSDSLILDVISYYEHHKDDPYYPEALYYGGRVYSDLGDYPTSLKYFHRALDELDDDNKHLALKGHVLSQTGRLLNKMRMYKDAAQCIQQSLTVSGILKDTLNLMYDAMLLGHNYQDMGILGEDRKWYGLSRQYAKKLNSPDTSECDLFFARSYLMVGMLDSAYKKIQGIPDKVSDDFRNWALAVSAQIYQQLNLPDSATKYANLLIQSSDPLNKRIGYEVLFSPDIRKKLNADSLINYLEEYHNLLQRIMNGHEPQLEAEQQAHYNYALHERSAQKSGAISAGLRRAIVIIISCVLIGVIVILSILRKRKKDYVRLKSRLADLERLQQLTLNKSEVTDMDSTSPENNASLEKSDSAKNLNKEEWRKRKSREELMKEIGIRLEEIKLRAGKVSKSGKTYQVPETILTSSIYTTLREFITENRPLFENNELWKELESIVLGASPYFSYHLQLLLGSPVKEQFYHMALLIKCGFTPTEIAILIGRDKATVTYRRNMIGKMIFDDKVDPKTTDNIIRLL